MVASSKPVVKTDLAGQTLVTLRTLTEENPASLETYLKLGGYAALKRIVTEKVKPTDIITEIKTSGLRGRANASYFTYADGRQPGITRYLLEVGWLCRIKTHRD